MARTIQVALWSPGCPHDGGGNVGLPHLVALGSYVAERHGARVSIFDRDYDRWTGRREDEGLLAGDWDVIGLSCYSSFDFRAVMTMAQRLRTCFPNACLVVGGYHPSACPEDFVGPDSPFNYVVIGEGEIPLSQIVQAVQEGRALDTPVLGPLALPSLDELPPLRWDLLERYRSLLADGRSQLNINLSRGCPFACEFCMERGKRTTDWRAYSPGRAVEELRRLLDAFPRAGCVLRITDALFGFDKGWRQEVLERLTRRPLSVNTIWAVTRSDLLEVGDIARFHAADFAVGFGIESGDPGMLRIMRKSSEPERFLQRFADQIYEAEALGMPWGANFIAGHPGETVETLTRSAAWLRETIRGLRRPTGFISIDPYRYYPGSAVHQRLGDYVAEHGTRVRVPWWWQGAEPTRESTLVDASSDLTFERREQMRCSLFLPIAEDLRRRFNCEGAEGNYFLASLDEGVESLQVPLS